MTFQWTAVASFLYGEVAVLLIFCIPFISPLRWRKIFRFQLWSKVSSYWNKAFLSIIVILIVLFLDAAREVRKYSASHLTDKNAVPSSYDHIHMKLFRSQRNLYISGFSLFLWLVLRRIVSLIMMLALEMEEHSAMKNQVENANEAAKKYLESNEEMKKTINNAKVKASDHMWKAENEKLQCETQNFKDELRKVTEAFSKSQNDVSGLKKQCDGLKREYDRLLKEHEELLNTTDGIIDKKDQ
ncbi:hypothetical protein GDO86_005907 [Hymenochirus boettgeri]|uniref:Endoplasmic reticulum transmembrane protein n=1 Tax=Hymenochirus boettgeri TaxID=247094 RepID=A0A8T2JBV5_9PIPI|nr:hypothetical protein GDO86_005907 [Hymenochirus boettgeri]KAG8439916.1 hypothetical protein GDO86_005907 [Hymenochirus boettgeri]